MFDSFNLTFRTIQLSVCDQDLIYIIRQHVCFQAKLQSWKEECKKTIAVYHIMKASSRLIDCVAACQRPQMGVWNLSLYNNEDDAFDGAQVISCLFFLFLGVLLTTLGLW